MAGGRPTKFRQEMIDKAIDYLNMYHSKWDHEIPTVAGIAWACVVSRSTIYKWAAETEEFSYILEQCNNIQEFRLINAGLRGEYNSNIVKLVLGKHGYHNQVRTEVSVDHNKQYSADNMPEEEEFYKSIVEIEDKSSTVLPKVSLINDAAASKAHS